MVMKMSIWLPHDSTDRYEELFDKQNAHIEHGKTPQREMIELSADQTLLRMTGKRNITLARQ